jgi:predicted ester cyclase
MSAMYFYHIANGKIVKIRAIVDTLSLLRQLNAVSLVGQN